MDETVIPLSDRELGDWERWAGRKIQWQEDDVKRLVATAKRSRERLKELETAVLCIDHGSQLYNEVVELRDRVLRKPLGLHFTPEQLAAERGYVHLAISEGCEIVACLQLFAQEDDVARVKQVAVAPERQGEGLGRRIMLAAESVAGAMGATQVVLHAREGAYEFYLRLGYSPEGEPFDEIGIRHWVMRKTLTK